MMRFPSTFTLSLCLPLAETILTEYICKLGGTVGSNGYPIVSQMLPPDEETPKYTEDERFSISVDENQAVLSAHSHRGLMYAVFAFLEDNIGCRFWSDDCETLPSDPSLSCGSKDYEPAFRYREVYWRGALDGRFALAMKLNSARADLPSEVGRVSFFNYSHTFESLVPPETYFENHPEYFSLVGNERKGKQGQLCLSNPDVLALCVDGVKKWMRENPDKRIFSVAQNDWYGYCECEECRKLDEAEGSHAGTMISFVNRVADAIKEEFPNNYIHTFAYLYTRHAPLNVRPRENVIVRLCSIESCFSHPLSECDHATGSIDVVVGASERFHRTDELFRNDLIAWSKMTPNLFLWDYTTNYANYLQPFMNLHVMRENMRLFRDAGVVGVFEQGNYSPGNTSSFAGLKIYLLGHLLWNPDDDDEKLINEYLDGYYGEAAPSLKRYLEVMTESTKKAHLSIFESPCAKTIDDEALLQGLHFMKEALEACTTQETQRRVELEALSPRYLYLARMPLDDPKRKRWVELFEKDVLRLGVTEIYERRELSKSLAHFENAPLDSNRESIPYTFYRL